MINMHSKKMIDWIHGGKSPGPPKGNFNALKHGTYTSEIKKLNRMVKDLLKQSMESLAQLYP